MKAPSPESAPVILNQSIDLPPSLATRILSDWLVLIEVQRINPTGGLDRMSR